MERRIWKTAASAMARRCCACARAVLSAGALLANSKTLFSHTLQYQGQFLADTTWMALAAEGNFAEAITEYEAALRASLYSVRMRSHPGAALLARIRCRRRPLHTIWVWRGGPKQTAGSSR